MNKTNWAVCILACGFFWVWGLIGSLEFTHMANKINCERQPGFTWAEHLKHRGVGYQVLGLTFKTEDWIIVDDRAIDVYKVECVQVLHNMYKSILAKTGEKDQKLRTRIKGML